MKDLWTEAVHQAQRKLSVEDLEAFDLTERFSVNVVDVGSKILLWLKNGDVWT